MSQRKGCIHSRSKMLSKHWLWCATAMEDNWHEAISWYLSCPCLPEKNMKLNEEQIRVMQEDVLSSPD